MSWLDKLGENIKYAHTVNNLGPAYYVTSQAKEDLREQGKEEEAREIEKAEAVGTVGGAIAGLTLGKGVPALMKGVNTFRTAHPIISGVIDAGLTAHGVKNALSDNGILKTINYIKDGNWGRAAASGAMDALDLLGGVGLIGDVVKGVRYFKYAPNIGQLIYDAFPSQNVLKRGLEGLMRQSSRVVPDVPKYINLLKTNPEALRFILTGKVPKSFTPKPMGLPLRDLYVSYLFGPYDGTIPALKRRYESDMIDAYLYGKRLTPELAHHVSTGNIDDFGPLTEYVLKNYGTKLDNIPVYTTETPYSQAFSGKSTIVLPEHIPVQSTGTIPYPYKDYLGENNLPGFITSDGKSVLNVGGHTVESGIVTIKGIDYPVVRGWDIWKFNPKDYIHKWAKGKIQKEISKAHKYGIELVDLAGTPIITRTGWSFLPGSGPTKTAFDDWYFDTYIMGFKSGGSIHIKKKNKGKFTASAKAAGEGVQEHAHKVMNDPNATPLQKKRANFAIQAKKWHRKHQLGGKINYLDIFA